MVVLSEEVIKSSIIWQEGLMAVTKVPLGEGTFRFKAICEVTTGLSNEMS